jgi:transposase
MGHEPPSQETLLLRGWRGGDRNALDALIPLVYKELRRLAHFQLRDERPDHTLQSAALDPTITKLTQSIEKEVEKCPAARRLQTHPGVGSLTALAFVLIIGRADRFHCGKQIASYLGLVPLEKSSGNQRRLGHITKQGNTLLRFLLVEAAQVTVRSIPEWRSKYFHLAMRRGRKIAKVAMARRLAVQMYWMMRKEWDYQQLKKFGSHAGQPGTGDGVK